MNRSLLEVYGVMNIKRRRMKNRSVKLSVDEPCHEDWEKMTPVEQGRFCSSCSKVVVDFSGKSDHEVIRLIEAAKGAETCGQFASNQLNRNLYYPLRESNLFSLRAVLFGATLTSILGLESCKDTKRTVGEVKMAFVGGNQNEDTLLRQEPMLKGNMVATYDHSKETEITGTVFNLDSDKPISGAVVRLMNEEGKELDRIIAQDDGRFLLPLNWKENPDHFTVYAVGFAMRKFTIDRESSIVEMQIGLEKAETMLRGKVKLQE